MPNDIARELEKLADDLGVDRKRSIGEVARELKVETHVIRFWEEKFPQIKPEIGLGKRRYYYNKQLKVLKRIKQFLYEEGYTIAGLQKLLKKRKQNEYKDEDLDFILDGDFAKNVHEKNPDDNDFMIEDFIVENGLDEESLIEAQEALRNAQKKLRQLKSLLSSSR